jgi:hypothetical protein
MVSASLSVTTCPTTVAVTTTTTTALPSSETVSVPSGQAAHLVVFADTQGIMRLVAPKGWTCRATYGADGSGGLVITPPGEAVPANVDTGWHPASGSATQAIVGYETGASPVQGAALVCALFTAAAAATQQGLGQNCAHARPARESVSTTTSTEAAFEDPAGVSGNGIPSGGANPANGVVLYQPKAGESSAYIATCTLPTAQHDVCTAVLNHFVSLYG